MLGTAVGVNSLGGKTALALRTEPEDTPLQKKLGDLAESTLTSLSPYTQLSDLFNMLYLYYSHRQDRFGHRHSHADHSHHQVLLDFG